MDWFFKSSKPSTPSLLMLNGWRDIKWDEEETVKSKLKQMTVRNPKVESLRILVHGPVGAGKSSFINSINSIFQGRMTSGAIAERATDRSFTKIVREIPSGLEGHFVFKFQFKIQKIRDGETREFLPFVLCDIMGLEKGDSEGAPPEDLIKVLKGQIKDGHKFNPRSPCSEKDSDFFTNPTLGDRIHCLLSVIPADKVALMEDDDFKKMKHIREQASEMGIPQLAMLTKVDMACPEVQKDLKVIYRSKKIKEKMEHCSNKLGVAMNCIFPVKNYHEDINLKPDVNVLLMSALTHILNFANDHVEDQMPTHPNMNSSSDNQH
ncbi:interferon-induced protein 44-like [Alosa pseudoharengus]|uniref:interferon-induced protein 44-like n=1 Tax=Alosa pseudoharengus TaxID=34774 RepID=UPI003F8BCDB1